MATRWDPFRELMGIQNELNQLFGRTYGATTGEAGRGAQWAPLIDIMETPEKFRVNVELPGVNPEDVEISVEDSSLLIRGERRFYAGVSEESFHRIERRFGPFERSLALPQVADPERIEASFDAGVLTVDVPKREEAKPRKITVKAKG